jgi:hypothetical protein
MLNYAPRVTRLTLLRDALLGVAVLTSAATATVLGFCVYLFIQGYSDSNDPQSVAPLAFPITFLILAYIGLPLALACAASWIGYLSAARRNRRLSR